MCGTPQEKIIIAQSGDFYCKKLDIGYRYMDYGKGTFDSHPSSAPGETIKNELDMSSVHEIYIGARYNF